MCALVGRCFFAIWFNFDVICGLIVRAGSGRDIVVFESNSNMCTAYICLNFATLPEIFDVGGIGAWFAGFNAWICKAILLWLRAPYPTDVDYDASWGANIKQRISLSNCLVLGSTLGAVQWIGDYNFGTLGIAYFFTFFKGGSATVAFGSVLMSIAVAVLFNSSVSRFKLEWCLLTIRRRVSVLSVGHITAIRSLAVAMMLLWKLLFGIVKLWWYHFTISDMMVLDVTGCQI